MKKKGFVILIVICIIVLGIFFYFKKQNITIISENGKIILKRENKQVIVGNNNEKFSVSTSNKTSYIKEPQNYKIQLESMNIDNPEQYTVTWGIQDQKETAVLEKVMELSYSEFLEGKNIIELTIIKDNLEICTWQDEIYYIDGYSKQFLDELEIHGVSDYFIWMDINQEIDLLEGMGVNYIRSDITGQEIEKNGYILYDRTIPKMIEKDYKVIGILNGFTIDVTGDDGKISNDEELQKFLKYAEGIIERYPKIYGLEICNEPNIIYTTDEDIKWYSKMVQGVKNIIQEKGLQTLVIAGVTVNPTNESDTRMPSIQFLDKITKKGTYKTSDSYSFHLYDFSTVGDINVIFNKSAKEHKEYMNQIGGFKKLYITEMGIEAKDEGSENQQAIKLVQENVMAKANGIDLSIMFSFRNTGGRNWGINSFTYEPKKSYYALRNHYENTNGSEYIGTVNLAKGLEAYVFNKDGKPKIVVWTTNSNNPIQLDYNNFIAKDIYGNKIPNINGKLEITTSPVYIDNVNTNYYYKAIGETSLEKYTEFKEKYSLEIQKIPNLLLSINSLEQRMEDIKSLSTMPENQAIQLMKQHFDLGNQILDAYASKTLNVEDVKISSMLDMLNDIGNSYEDLVTVSAKTRNPNLNETKSQIDETNQIIEDNSDIEIIYPSKILEFANDHYEKSNYINELEEENDIKTGLIMSNDLHSQYLAEWAKRFTNITIDEYITKNPVTVTYSETELTRQDILVTLNIGADSNITSNNGKNTYTFSKNGEYTFEYTRRNRNFKETVKVSNIDKISPIVTGVVEGKVYTSSVTITVKDENLDKVELYCNGSLVKDYTEGKTLTNEGRYRIVATDKAGNETTVNFAIMKQDKSNYQINGDKICNIDNSTKKINMANKLPFMGEYIVTRKEQVLETDSIVATGDILQSATGKKYTLIVKGDLNGDGKVTIIDLVRTQNYLLGKRSLTDIEKLAADANYDGNPISISDLVRIQILILNSTL